MIFEQKFTWPTAPFYTYMAESGHYGSLSLAEPEHKLSQPQQSVRLSCSKVFDVARFLVFAIDFFLHKKIFELSRIRTQPKILCDQTCYGKNKLHFKMHIITLRPVRKLTYDFFHGFRKKNSFQLLLLQ